MIEEYKASKVRYKDLRFLVKSIYDKLDTFYKHKKSIVLAFNQQLADRFSKERLNGLQAEISDSNSDRNMCKRFK